MDRQTTRPTLLAVLAHPDDESFGMGGTLALYSWCGATVHLICATGGEEGSMDPKHLEGYASTADRRRAELDCAAQTLGLASVTMLGYRDSGMAGTPANQHPDALAAQPLEAVAARVTHEIRRLRPHVVLTFDPIGGYRHPDHIAIQRATVEAFHAAGNPALFPDDLPPHIPQRLYFHTLSKRFLRLLVQLMPLFKRDPRRFGRNGDIDLVSLTEPEFPIHVKIDVLPMSERKIAAGQCHASQGGGIPLFRGPLGLIFRLLGGYESFMQAWPPANRRTGDLLDGVEW